MPEINVDELVERLRADDLIYNRGPNYEPLRIAASSLRKEAADALFLLKAELAEEQHISAMLLSWAADHGEEPDLLLSDWQHTKLENASLRTELAAKDTLLAGARLTVGACENVISEMAKVIKPLANEPALAAARAFLENLGRS